MMLIDEARAETLYAAMGPATIISGGSAANTIAGLASFGGKGAFIGKVKADELGKLYRHDLTSLGVAFDTAAADGRPGDRPLLHPRHARWRAHDEHLSRRLPGPRPSPMSTQPRSRTPTSSISKAISGIRRRPRKPSARPPRSPTRPAAASRITLSDSFCVDRYRDEFLGLIRNRMVDIVFANEHELKSLYQTGDFDTALAALRAENILAVVTRSEKGALAVTPDGIVAEPVFPVERVVDTTGAGDLFAAGFLFGLTSGREVRDCAAPRRARRGRDHQPCRRPAGCQPEDAGGQRRAAVSLIGFSPRASHVSARDGSSDRVAQAALFSRSSALIRHGFACLLPRAEAQRHFNTASP